jgi:SAM-dependent methyltransferase
VHKSLRMKYYYREHILGYQKVRAEGKTAWAEIHGYTGFENFASREFLEKALTLLHFSAHHPMVLEYGCGTGPGACFLAERGFEVDGTDIIPLAIEMAKEQAKERNLVIHYEVQDICELPHEGKQYDMIVDSYCLQGIVTDQDRQKVFAAVRARLKAEGYYLISSAIFDESRYRPDDIILDEHSGVVYNGYGESLVIDMQSSIVYTRLEEDPDDYEDAIQIGGAWYLPVRRHRKPSALKAEIEAAGFDVSYVDVAYQDGEHMICVLR